MLHQGGGHLVWPLHHAHVPQPRQDMALGHGHLFGQQARHLLDAAVERPPLTTVVGIGIA